MRTLLCSLALLLSSLSANCGYGAFMQTFEFVNFDTSLLDGPSERANGTYYDLGTLPSGLTTSGTALGFMYDGTNKAILLNETTGALQQVVNGLTVGQLYSVEFEWWVDNNLSTAGLEYGVTGISSSSVSRENTGFNSGNYQIESFFFTANNASHTIAMSQITSGQASPIIDNIRVTAVPLPATLGLLLAGMPGLGLILRRARRA